MAKYIFEIEDLHADYTDQASMLLTGQVSFFRKPRVIDKVTDLLFWTMYLLRISQRSNNIFPVLSENT